MAHCQLKWLCRADLRRASRLGLDLDVHFEGSEPARLPSVDADMELVPEAIAEPAPVGPSI